MTLDPIDSAGKKRRRFWIGTATTGVAIVALWYFTLIPQFLVIAAVNLWHYGFTEEGYRRVGTLTHNLKRSFEPLPSDEEMVRHFQAHRGEIEKLVQFYRNYKAQPGQDFRYWGDAPEAKLLREQGSVYTISGSLVGGLWLPNPYSIETAKQVDTKLGTGTAEQRYGTIVIDLSPNERYFSPSRRYGTVIKRILYFPEVPKIVQGELWWPVNINGKPAMKERVADRLDRYPPNFERGSCVLRSIEPQWYLSLCRAY